MLSVQEATSQVRQRAERDWVSWSLVRGGWPLRVGLKAPKGADFDRDITAAQLWSASWGSFVRSGAPGTVITEPRRARGLGTYDLPVAWLLAGPEEALALIPDLAKKYTATCARLERAVAMPDVAWDGVEDIPLKIAKVVAELSDRDWRNATATVAHIAAGPGEATILRQLAVPGVHTKWIEDNAALIAAMLGVPPGPGDPKARLEAHIGLMGEPVSVPVYLACPRLRRQAGGLDRFTASVSSLSGTSIAPEAVLVVENRRLGNTLNFTFDGLAVVYGLGSGATVLSDLRWVKQAHTVLYWGDLDRTGLSILAALRRSGVRVRSVLMGEDTWDRYPDHQHDGVRDQRLSVVDVPDGLEEPEIRLYERFNEKLRDGGGEPQLEQEHIPMGDVVAAVAAALSSAHPPGPLRT